MLYKCAVQIVLYAKKGNALRQSASGHRTRLTCVSFWPIETKRTQKNSTLITVVIMIVFARFTNRECILKLRMQYLHRITNTFHFGGCFCVDSLFLAVFLLLLSLSRRVDSASTSAMDAIATLGFNLKTKTKKQWKLQYSSTFCSLHWPENDRKMNV